MVFMKIHFIGIGGIGVSALANYYLKKGEEVSGSDLYESEITKPLSKIGAKIFTGKHKEKNLSRDTDLVIYSLAVRKDNPELKKARKYKIKTKSYPEALGDLTKEHFTIAVCGMHGKSTTVALVSLILTRAGFDPTVIIGTKLKEFGDSNFKMGKSKYLVIEADEYKGAFLNYWPKLIVLITVEREHLDYYKDLGQIFKTFKDFIHHLPEDGTLIANQDDKNIKKIIRKLKTQKVKFKIVPYSLSQKKARRVKKGLKIPGDFNVSNALASLAVAKVLKIPDKISFDVLLKYHGAWRRFEIFRAILNEVPYTLISDYGHHPTQVKVTINAAREKFPRRRIILIYQPHQVKRTKILFKDFVKSFDNVDFLVLDEIYGVAGRERRGKREVSSEKLAEAIQGRWQKIGLKRRIKFIESQKDIPRFLRKTIKRNDVVMVMGAGDIYNLVLKLRRISNS